MLNSLILALQDAGHAAAEHAAEGGGHTQLIDTGDWLPSVTALIVFLVAFGILYVKVWPPIVKGLDARERKIRDEFKAAEDAREQAKAALAEYQRNLATARDEANKMITQAKSDAKAVAEELRNKNQAELTEMKLRATREIESAKQAAISAIYDEASNLAVGIASKILKREINEGDQQTLVSDSLHELARVGRN
jgi:F-type H+-transporting ATPase subunit b